MHKPTLLLLPGLMCDETVWQDQIHYLQDFVDIIVPDLSNAATPKEMVSAALKGAPDKFALAGHSMGGWVALEVMRHSPERVTKLCLLNTTAKPDSEDKKADRKQMIEQAERGEYSLVIARLVNAFVYRKEFVSKIKKMLENNKAAFINQERAMLRREDCMSILKNIQCPALIINSYNDFIFNINDAEILVNEMPHARLSLINDCGHMSPIEAAKEVNELMRVWLKLA